MTMIIKQINDLTNGKMMENNDFTRVMLNDYCGSLQLGSYFHSLVIFSIKNFALAKVITETRATPRTDWERN